MINALNNHRTFLTASAAVAAIVGLSACGSSTEQTKQPAADLPATVVETTVAETPAAESSTTQSTDTETGSAPIVEAAPVVDDGPAPIVETDQFIPASSPDLPCAEYTEATELPVFVCSKGQLVEDFQSFVFYADDTFVVDGFFGEATYDMVVAYQGSFGLEPTGVIDQTLMDWMDRSMNHAEPIDDEADADWTVDDEQYDEAVTHAGEHEYCLGLQDRMHQGLDDVSDEQIWRCEDLDVRLTSGD